MTVVLKAVAFGSTRGERQHRVFTVQGLNRRLPTLAEDHLDLDELVNAVF
jgi:hypothetical protein